MISNGIILGQNVYAKCRVFSVIYLLKMMMRSILLGFGFWFWWFFVAVFLFVLFCLTYCKCHSSKDKQQIVVLLHASVACWSFPQVQQSQRFPLGVDIVFNSNEITGCTFNFKRPPLKLHAY